MARRAVALVLCAVVSASIILDAHATAPANVSLGGLFPQSFVDGSPRLAGLQRAVAMQIAVDDINNSTSVLPNTVLIGLIRDSRGDPKFALGETLSLMDQKVVGVVGDSSSVISQTVQFFLRLVNKPQISYASTSAALSNKDLYDYFLRVVPSDAFQGEAMAALVKSINATRVATISSDDVYGASGMNVFLSAAARIGIPILTSQIITAGNSDVSSQMSVLRDSDANVIVVFMNDPEIQKIWSRLAQYNLTADRVLWVCSDAITQASVIGANTYPLRGLLGFNPKRPSGPLFDAFMSAWNARSGYANVTMNNIVPFVYDAVWAFAYGIDTMIKAGKDPSAGPTLLKTLLNTTFDGITGRISFDKNGDPPGRYSIIHLKGGVLYEIGDWTETTGTYLNRSMIVWPGPNPSSFTSRLCEPPCVNGVCAARDRCVCATGWSGTACDAAVCTSPCVHGNCTAPETCSCSTGYKGSTCAQLTFEVPIAPSVVYAEDTTMTTVSLHWVPGREGSSPITSFDVEMSSDGGVTFSNIFTGNATSYLVTGLAPGLEYVFRVRGRNSEGSGLFSTKFTARTTASFSSSSSDTSLVVVIVVPIVVTLAAAGVALGAWLHYRRKRRVIDLTRGPKLDLDTPLQKVVADLTKLASSRLMDRKMRRIIKNAVEVIVSGNYFKPENVTEDMRKQCGNEAAAFVSELLQVRNPVIQSASVASITSVSRDRMAVRRHSLLSASKYSVKESSSAVVVVSSAHAPPAVDGVVTIEKPQDMVQEIDVIKYDAFAQWSFDCFLLETNTAGRPLFFALRHAFRALGLQAHFSIPDEIIANFAIEVEAGYRAENPYHNSTHAADVVHALTVFVSQPIVAELISLEEILATIVAGAIHDLGHPGVTNSFLVATRDPLAITYNDRSVLENYHAACGFRVMLAPTSNANVFGTLLPESYQRVRSMCCALVLATDMANHFELLTRFKMWRQQYDVARRAAQQTSSGIGSNSIPTTAPNRLVLASPGPGRSIGSVRSEVSASNLSHAGSVSSNNSLGVTAIANAAIADLMPMLSLAMKAADISNPAKPFAIYSQWCRRIEEEFYRQGDAERGRGMPTSMFMDRSSPSTAKCQNGFISVIVKPLYEQWARFIGMEEPLRLIHENHARWLDQLQSNTAPSSLTVPVKTLQPAVSVVSATPSDHSV